MVNPGQVLMYSFFCLLRSQIPEDPELQTMTGHQHWLFPSAREDGRCMSENAIRVALRAMGYKNEDMTPHGFRAMASTILNGNGWPPDVVERQLAHAERNAVRAAYNHAEYLPQRREMMQWWADWLDARKNEVENGVESKVRKDDIIAKSEQTYKKIAQYE
jgi:integrase